MILAGRRRQSGAFHPSPALILGLLQGGAGMALLKRGRPAGACRSLSRTQENVVVRAITDKTPEQLKLPFALWTRPVIGRFIQERFGIRLPVRTLGHYLKRWGFTPQRPKRRARGQQPEAACGAGSTGSARPSRGGRN